VQVGCSLKLGDGIAERLKEGADFWADPGV
jgi:hypothetical protein